MKKENLFNISTAFIVLVSLIAGNAAANDKVIIVPLGGTIGNATPADVVLGRTFSSTTSGKGKIGTLVLPPSAHQFTNSNSMTFNLIPAGSFTMGSPDAEPGSYEDERPQHQVTLTTSFFMQTTEVTQKQWQDVIGTMPAGSKTGDDFPIERVNWFEAAWFANTLSTTEGRNTCYSLTGCSEDPGNDMECSGVSINSDCTGYRLPTEAQWEYAARTGTTTTWPFVIHYDTTGNPGQVISNAFNSNLDAIGWYAFNNTTGQYTNGTKPVARKQASQWGLYDMLGNVWEWCQDWYVPEYPSTQTTNPQGPGSGSARVIRGGDWSRYARDVRSATRISKTPDYSDLYIGFRLILPQNQ